MAMKYRKMGRALERVSEISLGIWAFASTVYGKAAEELDRANALHTLDYEAA